MHLYLFLAFNAFSELTFCPNLDELLLHFLIYFHVYPKLMLARSVLPLYRQILTGLPLLNLFQAYDYLFIVFLPVHLKFAKFLSLPHIWLQIFPYSTPFY